MKKKFLWSLLFIFVLAASAHAAALLKTPAELSDWTKATRSDEVIAYCEYMEANADGRIRNEVIGETPEGRPITMMVISYPKAPAGPEEVGDDQIVMYVQSSIHAGEIEGKEAMLIFAREVAEGKHDELLKNVVLLINPNANPDGADDWGENRITTQPMPRLVGTRANAWGWNLNRDYTKVEAPETQAAFEVLIKWDPALFIDAHATNGLKHRHPLVWDAGKNANNDAEFQEANRKFGESLFDANSTFRTMMKDVTETAIADGRVTEHENYKYIPPYSEGYANSWTSGDKVDGGTGTESYPVSWVGGGGQPRLSKTVLTLKNRFGILFECHSHNDYQYRVDTQYSAIYSAMDQMSKQRAAIKALIKQKDEENANRTSVAGMEIAMRGVQVNAAWIEPGQTVPGKVTISGYRFPENASGDRIRVSGQPSDTNAPWEWTVNNLMDWECADGANVPMGALYIFEPSVEEAVTLLQRHGVKVMRLKEDVVLDEAMKFYNPANPGTGNDDAGNWLNINFATNAYEDHYMVQTANINADWNAVTDRTIPAGYYVVSTAQPFGVFAAFMIEPKADDGLCAWNYYDVALFADGRPSGKFDILKTYAYDAIPAKSLETLGETGGGSGSSSGCTVFAIPAALVLLGVAGAVALKKRAK